MEIILFFICQWLFFPIFLIVNIIYILSYKKYLLRAGENIIKDVNKNISKIYLFLFIILLIISITLFIFSKNWKDIYKIIFCLIFLSYIIYHNIFSKINGIYNNGIIYYEYLVWNKIHSYKWLDKETISFLNNNGLRIDFKILNNKEKIYEIIKNNNIIENKL